MYRRLCLAAALLLAPAAGAAELKLDSDDIGGVVASDKGPEAGVWVIAETNDLASDFTKIVVTDDQGRYLLPDMPKAKYSVWVRGYGLEDSKGAEGVPGKALNLTAVTATSAAKAAAIYPANYWYALLKPPAVAEFPGTGPKGNGISPALKTQQAWMSYVKEECVVCHPLGDTWTRTLEKRGNSAEAWEHRITYGTGDVPDPRLDALAKTQRKRMVATVNLLGKQRALSMFADWTDRINAGELPREAPPRPTGAERNVVLSMWGWSAMENGIGAAVHDEITTDKRHPTVNANGPVYGTQLRFGRLATLDPVSHASAEIDVPGLNGAHRILNMPHNPMIDQKARVWFTMVSAEGNVPEFCTNTVSNPFAKYYPSQMLVGRQIGVYDPADTKTNLIGVCFNVHHLNFADDANNTLYFSGDSKLVSWLDTKVWDDTHDAQKAEGWCPMVLDTNGDGKITPDRAQWNIPEIPSVAGEEGSPTAPPDIDLAPADKNKDTQFTGFLYGMNISPTDHSAWFASWRPSFVPSGIVRFERGAAPPATCKTEYFEPPKRKDGTVGAYNARGVDLDSKGVAWVAFGSGNMGRFERAKCKTLKGPSATGQQCPEGWSFFDMPGPKVNGVADGTADWPYLIWTDLHNILGLGKDVPILTGNNSDALLAFLPDQQKWVTMRVPSPMGFFPRGMDGRIDDASAGWKGRGLWANFGMAQNANIHIEGVALGKIVKVQMRPDPLAR